MDVANAISIGKNIFELVKHVADLARQGLSDDEIEARLSDPGSVGADLIKGVEKRESDGAGYLGRKRGP